MGALFPVFRSTLAFTDEIERSQIPNAQALTIQLLGKEDLTLDDAHGSEVKLHQSWLASYVLVSPSEGIGAPVKAPLLKRSVHIAACTRYSQY